MSIYCPSWITFKNKKRHYQYLCWDNMQTKVYGYLSSKGVLEHSFNLVLVIMWSGDLFLLTKMKTQYQLSDNIKFSQK